MAPRTDARAASGHRIVTPAPRGARISLAIHPGAAGRIPDGIVCRVFSETAPEPEFTGLLRSGCTCPLGDVIYGDHGRRQGREACRGRWCGGAAPAPGRRLGAACVPARG